jgi:hypothetical protein
MASIDKNPGAKFSFRYCAYRLPNGKRGFRSTKQTDHAKALQFCRMLGILLARIESRSRDGKPRARELISEIARALTV